MKNETTDAGTARHAAGPAPGHDDATAAAAAAIDAQLLALAYERLRLALGMTLAVVVIFVGLLLPMFPIRVGIAWASLLLAVTAARALLWVAHRLDRDRAHHHRRWKTLFFASALASGLSWAFGAVALIPGASGPEMYLVPLTLLAVSAVSMVAMASQPAAMVAMQASALLPTAFVLALRGEYVEIIASAIVMAGMVTLLAAGRSSSAAVRSVLEARLGLERAVAATEDARARAEAASHAKTRFLANMSHELRTPLNTVIGAAQLMQDGAQDAAERAHLTEAIRRSGTYLLGLIESILDLSRIEAGELKARPEDFHLVEALDAVIAMAGVQTRARGVALACIVEPALPAWRHGDVAHLRQLLMNLLGNALKFTREGEVTVQVTRGRGADDVRLTVSDTGIGIDAGSLPHIFEPFRQGDDGADRRYGGSGLGLAIVRQLVDVMHGRIEVASRPGRGSRFTVELPLAPAREAPPEAPPLGLEVAFLEPHEASATALGVLLTRLGCRGHHCRDVHDVHAWALARHRARPVPAAEAWLLLDLDSPHADEVRAITARLLDPARVIGMTSREHAGIERFAADAPRHLVKPVTRAALASRLGAPAAAAGADGVGAAAHGVTQTPAAAGLRAQVLLVEDDALNQTIVGAMLRQAGFAVSVARDGAAALEQLRQRAFDVVLMDWQMPDMDGLEVTRRVRAGAAGAAAREVPIVALTANAFAEDRDSCLAAGMNDFLTKPVDANQLARCVGRWARTGERRGAADGAAEAGARAAHGPPAAPGVPVALAAPDACATFGGSDAPSARSGSSRPAAEPAAAEPPVFDPALLASLPMVADGSQPQYAQEVLAIFLGREAPVRAAIEAALAADDARALQRELRTLKSGAATVGALALAHCAAAGEIALRRGGRPAPDLPQRLEVEFRRLRARLEHEPALLAASPTIA